MLSSIRGNDAKSVKSFIDEDDLVGRLRNLKRHGHTGDARDARQQAAAQRIIDPAAVDRLLRDHAGSAVDAGDQIWSLLNLELWYRTFIDGDGVQTLPGRMPRAA